MTRQLRHRVAEPSAKQARVRWARAARGVRPAKAPALRARIPDQRSLPRRQLQTAHRCARRPVVRGAGTTVEYGGKVYGTLAGVAVDGADNTCQEEYLPLPSGPGRCVLAPDTPEVRANVVAKHTWSTHVVVLANGNSIRGKRYETSAGVDTGTLYNPGRLSTSGVTYKPSSCNLQVLYECDREFTRAWFPERVILLTRSHTFCFVHSHPHQVVKNFSRSCSSCSQLPCPLRVRVGGGKGS